MLPFVVQLEISLDIEFADKKNEHRYRANDAGVLADIGEIAGIVFWDLNSANLHTD